MHPIDGKRKSLTRCKQEWRAGADQGWSVEARVQQTAVELFSKLGKSSIRISDTYVHVFVVTVIRSSQQLSGNRVLSPRNLTF